ncbi:MAG TPA: transposase [Aquabacterium sp.]|nr:transposase [Aquabacterium sp.]
MARLSRLALGGHVHLAELCALPAARLAHDDEDRGEALASLHSAAQQHRVSLHAYALMDQRLYLLATPQYNEGLSLMVQGLGRRYVPRFNRRHGLTGRLWDGRFRATIVQPGAVALDAMLFVDGAAMEELGMAATEHAWSSARHHLGHARDPMLSDRAEYWQLGNTPFERERAYRARLEEGLSSSRREELAQAVHKGWAVGDPAFLSHLRELIDRPLQPRRRGRPARPPI